MLIYFFKVTGSDIDKISKASFQPATIIGSEWPITVLVKHVITTAFQKKSNRRKRIRIYGINADGTPVTVIHLQKLLLSNTH
jgi:hypothetical protein